VGFYIFSGGRRVVRPTKKLIQHKTKFISKRDGCTFSFAFHFSLLLTRSAF